MGCSGACHEGFLFNESNKMAWSAIGKDRLSEVLRSAKTSNKGTGQKRLHGGALESRSQST